MQDFESEDWFRPYDDGGGESEEGFEDPGSSKKKEAPEGPAGKEENGKKRSKPGKRRRLGKILPVLPWLFTAFLSVFVFTNSIRLSAGSGSPLKESLSYLNAEKASASSLQQGLSALGENFTNLSASPSPNFVENILTAFSLKSAMASDLQKARQAESLKLASSLSQARVILKGAPKGSETSSLSSLVRQAASESFSPSLPSLRSEAALISSLSSLSGSVALKRAVGRCGK